MDLFKKQSGYSVRQEQPIAGGRRQIIDFTWKGERVPGILLTPAAAHPFPAALLLHGYSLSKDRMASTAGTALLAREIATLSLDLPLHGERFEAIDTRSIRTPFELVRRWRTALEESSLALSFLGDRPDVDANRLALVGYSLGAYLALNIAAREESVRAVVLASAGDLPSYTPFERIARTIADPLKLVRRLSGRPLLMVHGRSDPIVPPEDAKRLFQAASEPKELRWWESGHVLPDTAIDYAAEWLAATIKQAWSPSR